MPVNLHGRNVLTLDDFSGAEIRYLLRLAADLKAAKQTGIEVPRLTRKTIALIYMGPLLRKNGVLERLQARGIAIEAPAEY